MWVLLGCGATDRRGARVDVVYAHTCALASDGTSRCWGSSHGLNDGIATRSSPSCWRSPRASWAAILEINDDARNPSTCSAASTRRLNARGIHLAFVELRGRLSELVSDHGLHETLDSDHFYPSIEAALADIARSEPGLPDSDGHDPV